MRVHVALLVAGIALASRVEAQSTHVVIVSGVGGEAKYSDSFYELGIAMADAARSRYAVPDSQIVFLAERPERDRARIRAQSTKANIASALAAVAGRAKAGDQLFVLLIGHGSQQDASPRFNVPGPDVTAADFARMLQPFSAQKVAFINASSASGEFIPVLAGENRLIVTATKSGMERNESIFAKHFVAAYAGDGADADKDGRVSVLEAYAYARREVARNYEQGSRLQTEHAMLEDDGDGKPVAEPDGRTGDGRLARRTFLGGAGVAGTVASTDPRVATLVRDRDALEARIDTLRRAKAGMDSTTYAKQLEDLLVELALKNQAIRSAEGRKP
jgi:hypothetical protein